MSAARAAAAIGLLWAFAACGGGSGDRGAESGAHARELFARHCALCHGERGLGDGPAAPYLHPPARDFSLGQFRLVSAQGGPSTDDLVATLRRGVPGSAMPSFASLSDADLRALAVLVEELAMDGIVRRAMDADPWLDEAEALDTVARRMLPGEPGRPFVLGEVDDDVRAHGADLFRSHCAACHGVDGRGRGTSFARHEDGSLALARDFTAGILKGGGAPEDIATRITAGLPGSSMPAFSFPAEDLRALVAHVSSLIPPGSAERFRQVRREVEANRVAAEPTDADWAHADQVALHTAPLAWHDGAVLEVHASAWHDGRRLWVRLRWADASRDDEVQGGGPLADAVALQFSSELQPALFGMGSAGHPVDLWHWSAARREELLGALDPWSVHGELGASDVSPSAAGGETAGASAFEGRGVGALEERASVIDSRATWSDGEWSVVFGRDFADEGVSFAAGTEMRFAAAVWNGAAGEVGGRKSVTIWHTLLLAP